MTPSFFIFGLGYTAQFFAQKLAKQGIQVVGTTRQKGKSLSDDSPAITRIDFDDPVIESYLKQSTHILISIPPVAGMGDPVLAHDATLISRHAKQIQWIGYLSSTGVYGDHQGNWVNEQSLCKPQGQAGILRLEAEQAWLSFARQYQLPLCIFRLAGIYGPGRNALDRIRSGKKFSIFKEGHYFSRIHVEDIVSVLMASLNRIDPLAIYNVADDTPEAAYVVDTYAASLLKQVPWPLVNIENASLSAMEREFYSSHRRVSNLKIKQDLQVVLQYPSYREGLTQIWRAGL